MRRLITTGIMPGLLLLGLAACQPGGFGGGGGGGGQAGQAPSGSALMSILPLILIFVVFYFLLIRPQQRKQRQHRDMLSSIRRGDTVVTGGGIIGTVIKVDRDNHLLIEIAPNVRVKLLRQSVSEVVRRPEPARGTEDEEEDLEEEEENHEEQTSGEGRRKERKGGRFFGPRGERKS